MAEVLEEDVPHGNAPGLDSHRSRMWYFPRRGSVQLETVEDGYRSYWYNFCRFSPISRFMPLSHGSKFSAHLLQQHAHARSLIILFGRFIDPGYPGELMIRALQELILPLMVFALMSGVFALRATKTG